MGGYATYSVWVNGEKKRARLFEYPADEPDSLSEFEREVKRIVSDGFGLDTYFKDAMASDPFKVAENILADHYGRAEMVEANYAYRPGVRY